jgi:hypothetical protein
VCHPIALLSERERGGDEEGEREEERERGVRGGDEEMRKERGGDEGGRERGWREKSSCVGVSIGGKIGSFMFVCMDVWICMYVCVLIYLIAIACRQTYLPDACLIDHMGCASQSQLMYDHILTSCLLMNDNTG